MATAQVGTLLRHIERLAAHGGAPQRTDRQLLEDFAAAGDEAAFAALVARHGPMVLRVCRRVLRHEQDAEDAFQAAFLVLARSVASIRERGALASFLHGVAYRTALKVRRSAARRRDHEARLRDRAPAAAASPRWDDVQAALDEEVQRLPEAYRSAFVLCALEGKSAAEAAALLGCERGTVSSRLTRARLRLRQRLARRGIKLSAVLAALAVAEAATNAGVPAGLARVTARSGALVAAGSPPAAVAPSHVAALAAGVTWAMSTSKVKVATAVLLAASLAAGAGFLAREALAARERTAGVQGLAAGSPRPAPEGAKPPASDDQGGGAEVRGRVLDPDGRPVRGAKLLFVRWSAQLPDKVWATSSADGRFRFMAPRAQVASDGWETASEGAFVLAAAEGYGFAVERLGKPQTAAGLTLRLVPDDVPIRGRVLDLQGKPVAGARVRVNDLEPLNAAQLYVPKSGDLTAWLAALKANKMDPWDAERAHFTELHSPAVGSLIPAATTGADGRFQLRGLGRERLAHLRIEGPTIATQIVNVMTRPGEAVRLPLSRRRPRGEAITYHGASFEVLAAPTKPVEGVVRDRDTGRPLAGVTVLPNRVTNPFGIANYNMGIVRATTDKEGRYRLVGLPKGEGNQLLAEAPDLPYLPVSRAVEDTPGLGPVTVDFALKRGVWVQGRVTEKGTGKPLGGGVSYYCFRDNPHSKEVPAVFGGGLGGPVRDDGTFRVVTVPGRGVIAVNADHNYRYLRGVGAERIKGPRVRLAEDLECLDTYPFRCQIPSHNTLVEIAPRPGDESVTCDVAVVPGRALRGTVLGPDGKPLAGARRRGWYDPLPGSDFTEWGLDPHKPGRRVLQFVHDAKKLAGFLAVNGDEKGPLRVRLGPWATLTGRLLMPDGEPLTGASVSCSDHGGDASPDKDGRFRIEGLTPGWKYTLHVGKEGRGLRFAAGGPKGLTLKAGETKDLGDLRVRVEE
jgi:RNA polymerase sigma factor (sigma-70 family)